MFVDFLPGEALPEALPLATEEPQGDTGEKPGRRGPPGPPRPPPAAVSVPSSKQWAFFFFFLRGKKKKAKREDAINPADVSTLSANNV